jgi:hypothetical protein
MKLIDQILRKPLHVAFGQALQGGGITSVDLVATPGAATVTITASDGSAAPIAGADASTAGVMTAADKIKLDGLSNATTQDFPIRPDIAAAVIKADVTHIRTAGHSTAGDGGGALYRRVGTEPTHALKVRSADLAWWELVPDSSGYINVRQSGAKGDGVTNDGQAFLDALGFASLDANVNDNGTVGVIVPPSDKAYNLGATTLQLKATVHLVGQNGGQAGANVSKLLWDANVTGIIVHRTNTIGATTEASSTQLSADSSRIEGLQLGSAGGTIAGVTDATKGHGIWLRARAAIRNITITGFPGNGINIVASAGGAADVEGNANNWYVELARITGCFGHGVFVDGADVNSGVAIAVDASSNGRWGIYDSSFLGNTYLACHSATNGQALIGANAADASSTVTFGGNRYFANVAASEADLVATTPGTNEAVWKFSIVGGTHPQIPLWVAAKPAGTYFHGGAYRTDNANGRNTLVGCYSEGGQGAAQIVTPTQLLGGLHGSGVTGVGFWQDGNQVKLGNLKFLARADDNGVGLELDLRRFTDSMIYANVTGDHASGTQLMAWDQTSKYWQIGKHANLAARVPINITTDLTTNQFGTGASVGGGYPFFGRGFFLGNGTNARLQYANTAAPTTGAHARGEIVWNINPVAAGTAGWICTVAGTPGTWKTFGTIEA